MPPGEGESGRSGAPYPGTVSDSLRVLGWPAYSNRREQPYNALLYSSMEQHGIQVAEASVARVLSGRYDVLHLHWPDRRVRSARLTDAVLRSAGLIALLDIAHQRRMKVVWTVHNLAAHEGVKREWLERRYWDALTSRLDGFICLSESGVPAARQRHPNLEHIPGFVIPHGHVHGVYPDVLTRDQARATLGIADGAAVIAVIGQVRAYKNIPQLMTAFRSLERDDAVLLVAGRARPESLRDRIVEMARGDSRIRLDLRFVPDDEVQLHLRAADLVVLNYREILNSGSALLALSFDRPLLVPRKGAMADLERSVGAEWVRTYDGDISAPQLQAALEWATRSDRPQRPPLNHLGWDRIGELTADAFHQLVSGSR